MENYENNQLQEVQTEEVYVTNGVIKATDVLTLIGSGLLVATGVLGVRNALKKKKLLKEQADFEARIIKQIATDNSLTDEQKHEAIMFFNKISSK